MYICMYVCIYVYIYIYIYIYTVFNSNSGAVLSLSLIISRNLTLMGNSVGNFGIKCTLYFSPELSSREFFVPMQGEGKVAVNLPVVGYR